MIPGVSLRPMRRGDVRRVGRIERESFTNPWKESTFRRLLPRGDSELWVAEDVVEGVVGYMVLWFAADEGELADLAVMDAFRGKGIGSFLLSHGIRVAEQRGVKNLFLEVRSSNRRAAELYRHRGFDVISVRRNYYRKPTEDALVMLKSLWDRPLTG